MQDSRWKYRPKLAENIIIILAALPILEQHSRLPEMSLPVIVLCAVPVGIVIAGWIVRASIMAVKSSAPGEDDALTPGLLLDWLTIPVITLLLLFSALTHWPASIRFYFSQDAFEQAIENAYENQGNGEFPRWMGLYWVEGIHDAEFDYQHKTGTFGFVTGESSIDECGLYYDPGNPTPRHHLTTRIAKYWYLTEW